MNSPPIVILSAARTPLGSFQGGLACVPAPRLGAAAVRAAVARSGLAPEQVTDVILGNVLQAGLGQAPARQAAIHGGLPASARAVTVHKVCGSGLQAIIQGSQWIQSGLGECVVAGGMENMSAAPYLLPRAREGYRLGHQQAVDSLIHDGLWDPYQQIHMGRCAELCVSKYGLSREGQDAYAAESFRRAIAAQKSGAFAAEITPVEHQEGKAPAVRVETDEGPSRVNFERMAALKPAFEAQGTITAANASSINDGAAALVLASAERAARLGLRPLARIVSFGCAAGAPEWFTTAPIAAARQALERAGWGPRDVDLWEVNEAFAAVPLVFAREIGIGFDRMNIHGGAIALGHPIGASGARIVVTLLSALAGRGRRGLAAICIGGGEALAVCVELEEAGRVPS